MGLGCCVWLWSVDSSAAQDAPPPSKIPTTTKALHQAPFPVDFVEGFYRSCTQNLPLEQCRCVLGRLQTSALTADQIASGALDEPTLLAHVQTCAPAPSPPARALSPDHGRWFVRLSSSPAASPVRCVSLDAEGCALAWIAAAEVSGSLGLPLWGQTPIEISGELTPDDLPILAAALIGLHTDPALTTIQVPPLSGRALPFGPLVGDGPDGCAQTTPPTQTALIQITLSASICDLEQLQRRLTGRAPLTYSPPSALPPSGLSSSPLPIDQARLAALLQHVDQATPSGDRPALWLADTTDAALLSADFAISVDSAAQLAGAVNQWIFHAERLVGLPVAGGLPLSVERARTRARATFT